MRRKIACMVVALALVASLPCRALAETPTQFFNNVASALGVTLDVYGSAWQDKTKAAYLAYIEQEMRYNLTSPNAIYDSAFQLEQITGYDIVYAENGILYMNTVTDEAGGAFGGVQVWWPNYSTLLDNYTRWVRLAVNEGPDWPHSGSGGTPELTDNAIPLVIKIRNSTASSNINYYSYSSFDAQTLEYVASSTATGYEFSHKQNSSYLTPPEGATVYYGSAVKTWIEGKVADGKKIFIYINNGSFNVYAATDYQIVYGEHTYNGETVTTPDSVTFSSDCMRWNWNISSNGVTTFAGSAGVYNGNVVYRWATAPSGNGSSQTAALSLYQGWISGTASSGPVVPPATDDTPPSGGDILPITITWPDITYTGPTYNYEGDTYNTTSGDIDWSPVTDRIDELGYEAETFYHSFESYRADFIQFWDAMGRGIQDLSNQLTDMQNKLRKVIEWLVNIFNKIPTLGGATTAPNPDTDEPGFWSWLGRLLDRIVDSLPDSLPTDYTNALGQLTGKFPFSIPWDMAAILSVMSQEPVTPEFDITMVTWSGTEEYVHVSLGHFDTLALLCRRAVLMWFALVLASGTYETLRGLNWSLFE